MEMSAGQREPLDALIQALSGGTIDIEAPSTNRAKSTLATAGEIGSTNPASTPPA